MYHLFELGAASPHLQLHTLLINPFGLDVVSLVWTLVKTCNGLTYTERTSLCSSVLGRSWIWCMSWILFHDMTRSSDNVKHDCRHIDVYPLTPIASHASLLPLLMYIKGLLAPHSLSNVILISQRVVSRAHSSRASRVLIPITWYKDLRRCQCSLHVFCSKWPYTVKVFVLFSRVSHYWSFIIDRPKSGFVERYLRLLSTHAWVLDP